MTANFKKQSIKITNFPFLYKKGIKNHKLIKRITNEACCSYRDYKLVLQLLGSGRVDITSENEVDMTNFIHRLGKIIDLEFEEIT